MRKVFLLTLVLMLGTTAWAKALRPDRHLSDYLLTNVQGTSLAAPPYIHTARSERGLAYMLGRFKQINNRATQAKIKKLEDQLKGVDFSKNMVVAVFSQPMDNFKIKVERVDVQDDLVKVQVSYEHQRVDYKIPPKKKIYYEILVMGRFSQPVLLESHMVEVKSKIKAEMPVTVTGRLMPYKENVYQLIPVKIKRGKKNSYYIRGEQAENLSSYLGKVVTLQGTVSHEKDGPYESDLNVEKLVKAYD